MKKIAFATIASTGLAALAIGLAAPALAEGQDTAVITLAASTNATATSENGQGTVALPPGGPAVVFPQDQNTGGANPYTPFGTNPDVPYGVWAH